MSSATGSCWEQGLGKSSYHVSPKALFFIFFYYLFFIFLYILDPFQHQAPRTIFTIYAFPKSTRLAYPNVAGAEIGLAIADRDGASVSVFISIDWSV